MGFDNALHFKKLCFIREKKYLERKISEVMSQFQFSNISSMTKLLDETLKVTE